MALEKSPVSPSMWLVAIADALAVVKVGNSEWLLRRLTPSRAMAAMVGAVVSSTMRARKPSATNSNTLCGRVAAVCAAAGETSASVAKIDVAKIDMTKIGMTKIGMTKIGMTKTDIVNVDLAEIDRA